MKAVHQFLDQSKQMLKRQTNKEANKQRKSPQAKTKQATKDPRQSLEVGKVTAWNALVTCRQAKLLQLRRDAERHDNTARYHCWCVGLGLRTSPHSPAAFQCIASMARLPSSSPTVS